MFCELIKCCEIILGPKIVIRLSYDRLWIGPQVPGPGSQIHYPVPFRVIDTRFFDETDIVMEDDE